MALQFPKDKRRVLGIVWVEMAPDGSDDVFLSSAGLADMIPLKAVGLLQLTLRQAIERLMTETAHQIAPGSVGVPLVTPEPEAPKPPRVVPVEVKDPEYSPKKDDDKGKVN